MDTYEREDLFFSYRRACHRKTITDGDCPQSRGRADPRMPHMIIFLMVLLMGLLLGCFV